MSSTVSRSGLPSILIAIKLEYLVLNQRVFSKAPRELGRTRDSRHPPWQMGFLDYVIPQKHIILGFLLEMDPGPTCPSLCPHHPPVRALSACILAGRLWPRAALPFACLGIRCPGGFGCRQWLLPQEGEIGSLPLPILAGSPEQSINPSGPQSAGTAGLV